jgi:hypothetical protein
MKPTTFPIPSVLSSIRHILVKGRVRARWIDCPLMVNGIVALGVARIVSR